MTFSCCIAGRVFPDPKAPFPTIESRRVKLAEMAAALPPGVVTVTPKERERQLKARQSAYDHRFEFR